jgi:hypothetical protein
MLATAHKHDNTDASTDKGRCFKGIHQISVKNGLRVLRENENRVAKRRIEKESFKLNRRYHNEDD